MSTSSAPQQPSGIVSEPRPVTDQVDSSALARVTAALERQGENVDLGEVARGRLLEHLYILHEAEGALRPSSLAALSHLHAIALDDVLAVARAYGEFAMIGEDQQAPELIVRVCSSTTCAMAGADDLLAGTRAVLGESIRVTASHCFGRCHDAPVALAGARPVHRATPEKITQTIEIGAVGVPEPVPDDLPISAEMWTDPTSPLHIGESIAPRFCCFTTYRSRGGYGTWQACLRGEHHADSILGELERAGPRGADGLAAAQWRTLRMQSAPRALVVSIDDDEPGSFKDRFYLERDPHRFLEGMLIAAWVTDAQRCYVHVRSDYAALYGMLGRELARLREAFGVSLPDIELRRGTPAYLADGPQALLASLEGRVANASGTSVSGLPTVVAAASSVTWLRDIVERGGAWYAGFGLDGAAGVRALSVAGRVREPGLFVAPADISVRRLVDDYADGMLEGHELYAYWLGGACILPASLADLALNSSELAAYGADPGAGSVIVFSQIDQVRAAVHHLARAIAQRVTAGQMQGSPDGLALTELLRAPTWGRQAIDTHCDRIIAAGVAGPVTKLAWAARSVLRNFS